MHTSHHPFIVQMLNHHESASRILFVMEFCKRGDLFSVLQLGENLHIDAITYYTAEVTLALEYIHKRV